jgi:hypothetical protein
MSFLFADRKKQIAVVNKPAETNASGLFITGSLDLLNQTDVTGLANATLVGNLLDAAELVYPSKRGSLNYYNGLVVEGLPHIALSPVVGGFSGSSRINGIGIGLGYSTISTGVSAGSRIYNKPEAVLDIEAANADVRITGGQVSTAGTSSLIMVGSKASVGAVSGFRLDVSRLETVPSVSEATMYLRPFDNNVTYDETKDPYMAVTYDGNVGLGTKTPRHALHIVSKISTGESAVSIETSVASASGLTIKTNNGNPFRVITGFPDPDTEAIALFVASSGIVGVKMDTSTISVSQQLNTALAVNGSIMATNSVHAFGTFTYQNSIFEQKDSFNVSSIAATPGSTTTWKITFSVPIVEYDASKGFTVLISENSGQKLYTNVTSTTETDFTVVFTDANGDNITAQSFSFAVFYNPSSLYKTASLVQAVF